MTRPLKFFWFSLLGFFGLHANAAFAGITQVLCSADLPGESVVPGATGCIDVLAWSWGASDSGTGGAPHVNVQDLSFTKFVDTSDSSLLQVLVTNTPLKNVVELRNYYDCTSCTTPTPNVTIKLQGVTVSSLSTGGSGGEDKLTENVTLSFDAFTYCYRPTLKNGLGPPQCYAYSKTGGVTTTTPF